MSEADRVFPARKEQAAQVLPTTEKRFIHSRSRRGGTGGGQPRVVEVVHVRHDRAQHRAGPPRPAAGSMRAETWPDGFSAKPVQTPPALDIAPAVASPVLPAVHVMPMWEPSSQLGAAPVAALDAGMAEAEAPVRRRRRNLPAQASVEGVRHYADPFAEDDEGANCLRCGYLVEPAREKRGLLTCAGCA